MDFSPERLNPLEIVTHPRLDDPGVLEDVATEIPARTLR